MAEKPRVAEVIDVWVAWSNTDLTEGRGRRFPLCVSRSKTTAERLGKGKGVQGSNCTVDKAIAITLEGRTHRVLGPIHLVPPSEDDKARDEFRAKKEEAIKRARELGLTDDEIDYIRTG